MPRADRNDAAEIIGPTWEGWQVAGGLLYAPEWRRGFEGPELRAMFWRVQLVAALESDLRRARADLDAAHQLAELHEQRSTWYRQQLSAESRLGLCLHRILF